MISIRKTIIEPNRECQNPPGYWERRGTLIICFIVLLVMRSGACARCKNLKARSPALLLTGEVLTEPRARCSIDQNR